MSCYRTNHSLGNKLNTDNHEQVWDDSAACVCHEKKCFVKFDLHFMKHTGQLKLIPRSRIKEWVELYRHSPSTPSRHGANLKAQGHYIYLTKEPKTWNSWQTYNWTVTYPPFKEPKVLLLCLQELDSVTCSEPDEQTTRFYIPCPYKPFCYCGPIWPRSSTLSDLQLQIKWLDSAELVQAPVAGSSEHANEPSVSINGSSWVTVIIWKMTFLHRVGSSVSQSVSRSVG
jgi:hypothetical protein